MLSQVAGWAFNLPRTNPGFATSLTGIYSIFGIVGGFSLIFAPPPQGTVGGGIAVLLISLLFLGLVIYAASDTQFFQDWIDPSTGAIKHGFVRWTGGILLGLTIIATVLLVVLIIEAIRQALANS